MIFFPQAKINLGLEVLYKREDGFHEIQSCLFEVPIADVLEILPSDRFKFSVVGTEIQGHSNDNLCVRAFRLMQESYDLDPVEIILLKNIPMGAGLGGGSSDAAATITGLNEYFNLKLDSNTMQELAAQLGSDCPFFIEGGAQIATGRGEILEKTQLDLNDCWIHIINPGIHISTKEAYEGVRLQQASDLKSLLTDFSSWQDSLYNSFEAHIFRKHKELQRIKDQLYKNGAFYASMSGSGSTMFGLFENKPKKIGGQFERIVQL